MGLDSKMAKSNMKPNALTAYCRACHSRIRFTERPELYDIFTCPECDEALEVISLSPIRLDWPSDFGDDDEWSDDNYDDPTIDN
jgi:lysine biosynthesis protein LysW